ncbi:hypothetical protein OHAE_24 [Ochrobactrum soli]|uniref:Uncharacterized protein n=1 Tax=Ochrobactrum soli TaxID=2448455 RepID=A0A2P9HJ98_9HYPH|nr:hypothetical protein OHAE_24 [[Ochrobactrum] soli]
MSLSAFHIEREFHSDLMPDFPCSIHFIIWHISFDIIERITL